jgi:hypothetical protein
MPGIGLEMDGAMQHAPQPLRQFIVVARNEGWLRYRTGAMRIKGAAGLHRYPDR